MSTQDHTVAPSWADRHHRLGDVARRLGGPNSVTLPGFVIALGFTLVFGAVGASASGAGAEWLLPTVAGHSSAYGVLWLARRTVLRNVHQTPRPWRTLLCFGVAAVIGGGVSGGVAGAVTRAGDPGTVEQPPGGVVALLAVLATVVAFSVVSSFSAVVVDAWREHRAWSAERQTQLDRLAYLRSQASTDLAEMRRERHALVAEALRALADAAATSTLSDLADRCRRLAFDLVRPVSHHLATTPVSDLPSTPPAPASLRDFTRELVTHSLVRPLSLTALVLLPGGLLALLSTPMSSSLPFVISTAAVVSGVSVVAAYLTARWSQPWRRVTAWLVGLGIMAFLPTPIARTVAEGDLGGAATVTGFASVVFGVLSPIWLVGRSAVLAGRADRRALESAVGREMASLRQNERLEQDRLAKALHGRVQSALLACALKVSSQATDTHGDTRPEDLPLWLEATVRSLAVDLERPPEPRDLVTGIADLCQLWAGVCEIQVDLHALRALGISRRGSTAVLRVATELSTNAIVHGGATRLDVSFTATGHDEVVLDIVADGTFQATRERAMGSAILDELTSSWWVQPSSDGVVSRAVVPTEAVPMVDLPLRRTT